MKANYVYKADFGEYRYFVDLTTGDVMDPLDGFIFSKKWHEPFWQDRGTWVPIEPEAPEVPLMSDVTPELQKAYERYQDNFGDPVNSPSHYGQGSIEAIDYIEDFLTTEEYIGYLRGNIAKYLHRWRYKNGVEDLKKAQWYLNRLIATQEEM